MNDTTEPGQILLELLALLGWELTITRGARIRVKASRQADGLEVEAAGPTLADASFCAYEAACRTLLHRRESVLAPAA